ncbi:MAG: glycerol-3-phosphate 1-O-acyltransferase PlsY [Akkermansiaceae bacterium]|jgi:acyl phosphate:glycerol-3-phosphate acyltransferase|nr:glycerol-3-phosphate 1-O-acyltransferase PlsY [Akkermansiaceae bacterium]MDP4646785.1 glycerol-3-phosphate 1-O-acyltransferase PlsY [Akkermansiaceae bacterium]MDP4720015.1 glycerol-3-phosphate 1-O-acyltransferase PlsY [Akkermansiaceae bacterium]MDP4779701.1 glycerol-3-phosphate 1-O-acyltransferase PlsY [Akkermansiaceae bacterium]MDP4846640.1 glycerol-3-phosphate 1-O-acyltransferase PlsY [Akkermansiaceae bacterium]
MQLWFCPLLAFLLGSIPFGLFIAKAKGIDIRQHGSGNIGATNVFRVVGKKFGLSCLFLDLLKGFIPVVIAVNLVQITGRGIPIPLPFPEAFALKLSAAEQLKGQLVHVITALAAVLGHNYSPWIGFKGGKGIATSAGVLIGLMPAAVVILLIIFILTLLVTRYVAVASMVGAASLPILTHLGARFHKNADGISLWEAGDWNKPLFALSLLIGIMAIWKHRTNIRRLCDGTESRFVWGGKAKQEKLDP